MPKTVDPVFSSSVLAAADLATALDIDALTQSLAGLEGKVDKNPKTAAIILAGGTGERLSLIHIFRRSQGIAHIRAHARYNAMV